MQEFLIIFTLVLAIFFWLFGARTQNWFLIATGAVFFLLLGVGLFNSGWDRFEGNTVLVTVGDTVTVTPASTNYAATLAANPSIWGFATIILVLSLALVFSSGRQYRFTKMVQLDDKTPDEQYYVG